MKAVALITTEMHSHPLEHLSVLFKATAHEAISNASLLSSRIVDRTSFEPLRSMCVRLQISLLLPCLAGFTAVWTFTAVSPIAAGISAVRATFEISTANSLEPSESDFLKHFVYLLFPGLINQCLVPQCGPTTVFPFSFLRVGNVFSVLMIFYLMPNSSFTKKNCEQKMHCHLSAA